MFKKVQAFDNAGMDYDKEYQRLLLNIANRIKVLRLKADLTQEDMAEQGFNYRHYQKLESGKHSPSLYTLYRLARIFRVKLSDLIN